MAGVNSNYPGGFNNGISIRGMPIMNNTSGDVYWVDDAGSNGIGNGSFAKPFATIDYAIGQCTANNGDEIHVKAGHAETISAASAIDFDVAGITVIGHGTGTNMPTITMDTANTVSVVIDAAGTTLYNLRFVANFADIAECIDVGAVAGVGIYGCKWEDSSSTLDFVECVAIASGASDFHFVGNTVISSSASADSVLQFEADTDDVEISYNTMIYQVAQTATVAMIDSAGDLTALRMFHNYFVNQETDASSAIVDTSAQAANSGLAAYNYMATLDSGWAVADLQIDITGAGQHFNFIMDAASDLQGTLSPAVDAAT